ncbi:MULTISPECIES: GSCFA domain-containing protein [unclassified Xanthobacter]|uniref:GSCFA domain-containing protein n=1 Tax=unclassified Xanthobacter TaxID=2623496 RepID=UPI001F486A47|nr:MULTISPECIES: GSCFA domain-containing protein [unclassified Xanthobacter]
MQFIRGELAWKSLAAARYTRWSENIERFKEAPISIFHKPKFTIDAKSSFFCIGSCFARNIEEHLIYRERAVLSKKIVAPKSEAPARPNGFVNKFTTMSMVNELKWAVSKPVINKTLFEEGPNGWSDLQLGPGIPPVSLERAIERRTYLIEDYFSRVRNASVVVVTLGLNEVWWDNKANCYLNCAPSFTSVRRERDRYRLVITDVAQSVADLEEMRWLIKSMNRHARLIVTVSPVPMSETFSGQDVAIANMRSKSTLRVAAEQFAALHPDVDYFPSYDIVSLAPRNLAYGVDCLHVSNAVVGEIMRLFLSLYVGIDTAPPAFTELGYLAANPDVDEAVRRGEYESGFEHWRRYGKAEGRPLMPAEGPTELMIAAGAV